MVSSEGMCAGATEVRKCRQCGKEFEPAKSWQEFCSHGKGGCQQEYWKGVYREARKIVMDKRATAGSVAD